MTEELAVKWVKNKTNQKMVVNDFFIKNKPTKLKVAFYMAGIPGSGKTEFAYNTINEASPELISIEHDKLVEYIDGYRPEKYYNYRKAGNYLVSAILEECLKNGYGFIFDGTLSHPQGIINIHKTLNLGYRLVVIYIIQDSKKAWDLTQDRELLIRRSIDKQGFINTCKSININLLEIFNRFKINDKFSFWIINKKSDPYFKSAKPIIYSGKMIGTATEIESALNFRYNTDKID